jgi:phosphatidate cytidylyltransferase
LLTFEIKTLALNIQTFKTRTLTAIIFVMVMFAGLFINVYLFLALFTLIMFGCLFEFSKIVKIIHPKKYFLYLPIAFFYIIIPIILMLDLGTNGIETNTEYSPLLPCAILFSIWINDTSAYLVGSFIGKTPFSKISPKKTWEGTIGGGLLCILIIALLGKFIPIAQKIDVIHWIAISSLCAVFGTIGDLIESKLKRIADIKDSGSFMPGHGGFLDRFDSLLIATPFVWGYIHFFIK